MPYSQSQHYSHKFELKINKAQARQTDKISWSILYSGIIFGFLLFSLGLCEILSGLKDHKTIFNNLQSNANTLFSSSTTFYDIIFMILGISIVVSLILSRLKYKKIILSDNTVKVIWRPVFGKKRTYVDTLQNYLGVLYRVEFHQVGFINQNRYIVELYHHDPKKTIPLYISSSDKDVRKKWRYYAKELNKPTILYTEDGLNVRNVEDINLSIRQRFNAGKIKDNYEKYSTLPDSIAYVKKKDKIIIKAHKIIWDAYSILAWFFVVIFSGVLTLILANFNSISTRTGSEYVIITSSIIAIVIAYVIMVLFRKDKIVIKKDKIIHTHKYMLFSKKHDEIFKNDIEDVEINCNPLTARNYLSIISDNKTITVGKKLPIEDLSWIKKLLIHLIIE